MSYYVVIRGPLGVGKSTVANRLAKEIGADRILIDRILDGNFYWKSQIEDLIGQLDYRHYVFTLKAPLSVCVDRDSRRATPHGSQAAREVYAKSTKFDYGIGLDATRPIETVVREIVSHLLQDSVQI